MSKSIKESIDKVAFELEKASFLNFLDKEISSNEASVKKDGQSPWIIYASIATLIAYLFTNIESVSPNWFEVGSIFLLLVFGYDLITAIHSLIKGNNSRNGFSSRFYISGYYNISSRISSLCLFVRSLCLFLIFENLNLNSSLFLIGSVRFIISLSIIALIINFLISFFDSPKSITTSNSKVYYYFAVILIFPPLLISFCGFFLEILILSPSIQSWKIGAAVSAIFMLLDFIIENASNPPALIDDLKTLRRQFVLGELTIEFAKQKADRIIFGLTLDDVVQPCLKEIFDDISLCRAMVKSYEERIELLEHEINFDIVRKFLAENAEFINDYDLLVKSLLNKKISRLLKIASRSTPEDKLIIDKHFVDIKNEITYLTSRFSAATDKMEVLLNSFNGSKELKIKKMDDETQKMKLEIKEKELKNKKKEETH